MLRLSVPLQRLRRVPVLGDLLHLVSHRILPASHREWVQIRTGPGRGLWLELNPRTGGDYLRGRAESRVQEALAARLRPGMVFYDLGANIGLFSLLAARIVGPTGRVYSFEPDTEVVARLRRNVERNGFSNVTVVESGVWSSNEDVRFIPSDSSSPDRGLGRIEIAGGGSGRLIRCVTLDDFQGDAPDAIKCDVEGAEFAALKGAEILLRWHRPWIICEMHSAENDRASRGFLSRCGYSLESIDDSHILAVPSATRIG